ncbi:MAG: hypothetical protein ACE5GV_17310 [Candidatus Scalindua sp.]
MKNYWWYTLLISIAITVVWKMFGSATAPFYIIILILYPLLGIGGQLLLIIAGVIFNLYEKIKKRRGDDKKS